LYAPWGYRLDRSRVDFPQDRVQKQRSIVIPILPYPTARCWLGRELETFMGSANNLANVVAGWQRLS
jgi:hypothetical protein